MAIKKGDDVEQRQLFDQSIEELHQDNFDIDDKIFEMTVKRKKHTDAANSLKNEIKVLEADKQKIVQRIKERKNVTLVPYAVEVQRDKQEADPTDEDLAEFEDAPELPEGVDPNAEPPSDDELAEFDDEPEQSGESEQQTTEETQQNSDTSEDFELGPEFEEQRAREIAEAEAQHATMQHEGNPEEKQEEQGHD